ncbi:exporter of polyketide antibiotics [Actinoplanes philippinensis]|uniref:ABC-2 type transport system permease protein n=1 Tax=Actinoplanes philippinensis TaxID=35752 RepID=A0A1I2IV78_9ACTN|nr:ABC transporter permease [Actinoplanes philippinensis]GIE78947.1 exporter of polyketide antibiotics [Actinoplanes philippinensis]SFF45533.1 ABC-2 type transport system permease protein [Actinoplanes philippinensis]
MTGTLGLIRLALRLDRVVMPLWVFVLGLLPVVYVSGFDTLFATAQERIHYAQISAANAGFVGLYGPLHGDSLGELTVWRGGFLPVMIGLAALLTVIRHTRADEEAGRTELLRAGVTGRFAPLAAAVLVTAGACLVMGVLVAVTLIGHGLPAAGSVALAVSYTVSGWLFAGVGAVAAQIADTGRAARAIAVLVLGVSYVLRMGGDISALGGGRLDWMSWLSPIGWAHRVFPFGADDWWPVVPAVVTTLATVAASAYLLTRRDLGGGLLAGRLGPASAAASLGSPIALAWRLHRGLLAGWTAGFAALGLVFGGVSTSVAQLAEDSASMGRIFSQLGGSDSIMDAYFASIAQTCALIIACYAVQAALRIRDEEQTGHAEAMLSTDVSRWAWGASHLIFALLGPAAALLAEGLVAGLVHGDPGRVVASALAQLPAVWVLAGVATLLIGVAPKLAAAAWAVLAGALLILIVGPLVQIDQWVLDLSPFTHVPHLPGASFTAVPLLILTLIAAALGGAGLLALRRRDLPA